MDSIKNLEDDKIGDQNDEELLDRLQKVAQGSDRLLLASGAELVFPPRE